MRNTGNPHDTFDRPAVPMRSAQYSRVRQSVLLAALAWAAFYAAPGMAQSGAAPTVQTAPATVTDVRRESGARYENYAFRDGKALAKLRLHYATLGSPHRDAEGEIDNAVLMLHWTAADGGALLTPEFMKALYGPGRPLDAKRYFLVFPDNVGHGQSSKPSDGLKTGFPAYGYQDMVEVTETLGIKRLHAIVGVSMGGMNAWQWAEAYPESVEGIIPVVALPTRISGRNLLWRRMIVSAI